MVRQVMLIAAASVLAATPVVAQDRIGEARAAINAVSGSDEMPARPLSPGMSVSLGDTVETDSQGLAQLLLSDGTAIVVGPGSSLVLDDFDLDAENGAFRTLVADGQTYGRQVRSPIATIDVRGSDVAIDFDVLPTITYVLLSQKGTQSGNAEVCLIDGNCETLDEVCEIAVARAESPRGVELIADPMQRSELLRRQFSLLRTQERLNEQFRVDRSSAEECLALVADAGGVAPSPLAGGLPAVAAPIAGLALIGGALAAGLAGGGGGDDGGTTGTTGTQ